MARPIFEAWLAPFKDLGATHVTGQVAIHAAAGRYGPHVVHLVGLPGFSFIQDPMEYQTRTHHSNMDVYDRVQRGDLMQASAIMASFVYNTATRAEMMPRVPKPLPRPERRPESADTPDDRQ